MATPVSPLQDREFFAGKVKELKIQIQNMQDLDEDADDLMKIVGVPSAQIESNRNNIREAESLLKMFEKRIAKIDERAVNEE